MSVPRKLISSFSDAGNAMFPVKSKDPPSRNGDGKCTGRFGSLFSRGEGEKATGSTSAPKKPDANRPHTDSSKPSASFLQLCLKSLFTLQQEVPVTRGLLWFLPHLSETSLSNRDPHDATAPALKVVSWTSKNVFRDVEICVSLEHSSPNSLGSHCVSHHANTRVCTPSVVIQV